MYQKYLILSLTILFFFSCSKEENFIDPLLQPHVDNFFNEANKRNLSLSTNDIQAFIIPQVQENGNRVCGLGYAPIFGDKFRRIEIDQLCWNFSNESEREILVFHELGHALLDRQHNDWKLPNGRNRSIMFAGENCDIYASYSKCQIDIRSYYLDELFKQGTTIPSWAKPQNVTRDYFTDNFDTRGIQWESAAATTGSSIALDSVQFNSPPYSLRLSQSAQEEASHTWIREVSLSPIKTCSTVMLQLSIKTENFGKGQLRIVLSYPNFDENGMAADQCTHSYTISESPINKERFQNYEYVMPCLPGGKKDVEMQLILETEEPAAVLIDNFDLKLSF